MNNNYRRIPDINTWAAITGVILAFLISYCWFVLIFREPYLADLGKSKEELNRGPSMLLASVIQVFGYFITALILGWLIRKTRMKSLGEGILLSFLVWVGFVAAVLGPMYAFQAFPLRFFFITTGGTLISFLVMGALMGGWRGGSRR